MGAVQTLDSATVQLVAVLAAATAAIALLLVVAMWLSSRRTRKSLHVLAAAGDRGTLVDALAAHTRDVEALRAEVASLRTEVQRQRAELSDAVRHVSVVRYDAFGDMGGRLSFSAALLDDGGDGIVLTAIHGRTDTRTYVKGILGGTADQLSPEEKEAITVALTGNRS